MAREPWLATLSFSGIWRSLRKSRPKLSFRALSNRLHQG
jgi:hypothetical protein